MTATLLPLAGEPDAETPAQTRRGWPLRVPGTAGVAVLAVAAAVALLAPLIAPYDRRERVGPAFGAPSLSHPFGLDDVGHDMLSLTLLGTRTSLLVGVAAATVAMLIGVTAGLVAGYAGRWIDLAVMQVTEYLLVIPSLPLMITVAALWGPSLLGIVLVIGLLSWSSTAIVVRAQVKSLRRRGYVARARTIGAGHVWIIVRHVLPHTLPLIVANTTLAVGGAIFAESGLAFLGLGDPTNVSWGTLIDNAFQSAAMAADAWWAIVPPGLCIAAVVLACNVVGQELEEVANPRLVASHLGGRRRRALVAGKAR